MDKLRTWQIAIAITILLALFVTLVFAPYYLPLLASLISLFCLVIIIRTRRVTLIPIRIRKRHDRFEGSPRSPPRH